MKKGRPKKIETIEEIVRIHGLALLNLYDINEHEAEKKKQLLNDYVELLSKEIEEYVIKKL